MGLYDRDYGRDERSAWDRIENPRSITITLIVINVAVFFADMIFSPMVDVADADGLVSRMRMSLFSDWGSVDGQTLLRPWLWWQFLSYGFLHDVRGPNHILFNMIGLFFFGRAIEQRLGRMEFLRFYLVAIVVGGIVGSVSSLLAQTFLGAPNVGTVGASGAVIATTILFACYYPNNEILLMFVFPVKAWVLAMIFVISDLAGAVGLLDAMGQSSNTAFTVHLAGAFFALLYYFQQWNLRWLNLGAIPEIPARLRQRSRRMKLKLHDPDKKLQRDEEEADRILAKIHQSGESSLTAAERKVLQRYSRRQREKRNQ